MLLAAMSMTWLTASTMTPITIVSCRTSTSTMTTHVVRATLVSLMPNFAARSTTRTTLPRRLKTPRIQCGVRGTRVTVSYSRISFTRSTGTAYSSPAIRKVKYCFCRTEFSVIYESFCWLLSFMPAQRSGWIRRAGCFRRSLLLFHGAAHLRCRASPKVRSLEAGVLLLRLRGAVLVVLRERRRRCNRFGRHSELQLLTRTRGLFDRVGLRQAEVGEQLLQRLCLGREFLCSAGKLFGGG